MNTIGTKYLFQCKINYLNNITPSNSNYHNTNNYKSLIKIAKEFIKTKGIIQFSLFLQEYQYCVNLWTAHLIIDLEKSNDKLLKQSLEVIKRYSETTLNKELAQEEQIWLNSYLGKIQ